MNDDLDALRITPIPQHKKKINSRTKGHTFERWLRRKLIELGFTDCLTSRNSSYKRDSQGVDFTGTGFLNVQAKCTKNKPDYISILKNMPQDEPTQFNVVINKITSKGTIAVMDLETFFKLIKRTDLLS